MVYRRIRRYRRLTFVTRQRRRDVPGLAPFYRRFPQKSDYCVSSLNRAYTINNDQIMSGEQARTKPERIKICSALDIPADLWVNVQYDIGANGLAGLLWKCFPPRREGPE